MPLGISNPTTDRTPQWQGAEPEAVNVLPGWGTNDQLEARRVERQLQDAEGRQAGPLQDGRL